MKNVHFFDKIKDDKSYKLALSTAVLIAALFPVNAYASEELSVEYKYNGTLIDMINPTNWDYNYNTAIIKTANTNITINSEELEALVDTDDDTLTISDGGSTITYNKSDLKKEMISAKESYNPNGEKVKKIILNGGVTITFLGATGLCIYNEMKERKRR